VPGLIDQAVALHLALKASVRVMDELQALRMRGGFTTEADLLGLNAARTAQSTGVGSRSTGGISPEDAAAQAAGKRADRQRKFDEAFLAGNQGQTRGFNPLFAQQLIDAINRLNGTLDRNDSRTGGGLG
jgi:hypothetical protein